MSAKLIIFIFLTSLGLVFLDFSNIRLSRKFKCQIFNLFLLLLLIVSATKTNQTSFDTNNYVNHFVNASKIANFNFLWYGWEPGYVLLNSLVKTFTNNYHIFFFVLTTVVLLLYRSVILRFSKHIFLSLFTYVCCFYFLNEIVILRFGLASAIVFFNINNIVDGKIKKSVFTVIFATMFHYTSIVAIIPIILYRKDNLKNVIPIYVLFFLLITIVFFVVSPLSVVAYTASIVNENMGNVLWRVLRYQGLESEGSLKRIIIYFPFLILLLLYFLNSYGKTNNEVSKLVFIEILYLLTSIFFMVTCREVASLARLNAIFLPVNILSCDKILSPQLKKDPLKYFYLLWVILFDTYIFVRAIFFNSGGSINLL